MKRVIALLLFLVLLITCGCADTVYPTSSDLDDCPSSGYIIIKFYDSQNSCDTPTNDAYVLLTGTNTGDYNFYIKNTSDDSVYQVVPKSDIHIDSFNITSPSNLPEVFVKINYHNLPLGSYYLEWENIGFEYYSSASATPKHVDEDGGMSLPTSSVFTVTHIDSKELYEPDPEVDIIVDGKTQPFKYGNKTIVLKEDSVKVVDYSKANAELESVIIPNKTIKNSNDIEFINKNAKVVIDDIDNSTASSVKITLAEGCATHSQKKAMNSEIVAQVTYACTSNGKTINTNAKIYVPCDMPEARVFYIIDEHTIGQWLCTIENGYCIFDRYLDGTYVICK